MLVRKPTHGPIWQRALNVLIGCGLSAAPAVAAAQQPSDDPRPQRAFASYFGDEIVRPGGRIGYEAAALFRRPHELIMAGSFGGYALQGGYALMVLFEGGYRLTLPFGGFLEVRPGLGYTAAWVDAGGGSTAVTNYFTLSGLGGIGYDFFRLLRVPLSIFGRSGVVWRSGSGTNEGVTYVLDAGLAYQFGTSRPKPATLPVAMPPPAEAPTNLDDPNAQSQPLAESPPPQAPAAPAPKSPPDAPNPTPSATPSPPK